MRYGRGFEGAGGAAGRGRFLLHHGGRGDKGATERVSKARGIARGLRDNGALFWVFDALDEAACLMKNRRGSKKGARPHLLARSASLNALVPPGGHLADTSLVWF